MAVTLSPNRPTDERLTARQLAERAERRCEWAARSLEAAAADLETAGEPIGCEVIDAAEAVGALARSIAVRLPGVCG
jgi:hypothetical protein